MNPAALLSLVLLTIAAPRCHAASYHKASPPNLVVLGYPDRNLTTNQTLMMGFDGGGEEVAGDYYGFAWSTTLSLVLPNGTHVPAFYTSNVLPGSSAYACSGFGSGAGPNTNESEPNASEVLYQTSIVGTYTLLWNVTYGTSTDPSIANQTFCDISRLSYETFIFNKSIDVVAPKPDFGAPLPGNTKEERTFHPTGFIMSNSAGFVKSSVSFVSVGVLCAFLQIL